MNKCRVVVVTNQKGGIGPFSFAEVSAALQIYHTAAQQQMFFQFMRDTSPNCMPLPFAFLQIKLASQIELAFHSVNPDCIPRIRAYNISHQSGAFRYMI